MESDADNLASALIGYPVLKTKERWERRDKLPGYFGWSIPKDSIDFIPKVGLIILWDIVGNREKIRLTHVYDMGSRYEIYIHNSWIKIEEYINEFEGS